MSILNKIGRVLLLDLINRDNNTDFTFNDVAFGIPAVIENPVGFRNTRVVVGAKTGGRYVGTKVIDYQRIDIAQLLKPQYRRMYATGVSDTASLVTQLNARFGLQIEASEVHNEFIDTSTLPRTYTLRFKPESYAFIGQVQLELVGQLPNLSELITVSLLDGFYYPSEPVISNVTPEFVTSQGALLVSTDIAGNKMIVGKNDELEVFVGVHGRSGQAQPMPVVDAYTMLLSPVQDWGLVFGVALLEEARGNDLTALYDVKLTITREGTTPAERLELALKKDAAGKLVWGLTAGIADFGEGNQFHHTQQKYLAQTSVTSAVIANAFPTAVKNTAGAVIGNFNVAVSANAKNAIYVNDINYVIRAQIALASPAQA